MTTKIIPTQCHLFRAEEIPNRDGTGTDAHFRIPLRVLLVTREPGERMGHTGVETTLEMPRPLAVAITVFADEDPRGLF
jgi:hypothetical protein